MNKALHPVLPAALSLALALGFATPAFAVSDDDAYMTGYVSAILERELKLDREQFRVKARDGSVTVVLTEADPILQSRIEAALSTLAGVQVVKLAAKEAIAPSEGSRRERVYSFLGLKADSEPFPEGELFLPLIADPKQAQFFIAAGRLDGPTADTTLGVVGFGETFGFHRLEGKNPGDGLQIGISGALFAQFNLEAPSTDLVNADYTIGLPITYRHAPWSARLRLYHQSSHLGDEFLLRVQPERVNLSFESLELLLSYEWPEWRGYFGGEYFLHRDPTDLDRAGLHGGLEYRGTGKVLGSGRLIGGLDIKSWEEHGWSPDASLKAGLEFGTPRPGNRRLRIMGEYYQGHSPYGQFYRDEITYYGLGMYFGF
ncbi:MAG: DUF1207 domain-containing protein [Hydrogenophilaceae bacterium]|nr:DUF1207 domain-containing protein [Hydrogenophilaceae bacterium]